MASPNTSNPDSLEFTHACAEGETLIISAVGDILLHGNLQRHAIASHDFSILWEDVIPYFFLADLSYANLEGTTAAGVTMSGRSVTDPGFVFDDKVYTSYPQFNYQPQLIRDSKM